MGADCISGARSRLQVRVPVQVRVSGPGPVPEAEHLNQIPDGRDLRPENGFPPPATWGCHPPPGNGCTRTARAAVPSSMQLCRDAVRPYLLHRIHSVLHADLYAVLDPVLNSGWASAQPIRRADECLEAGELDVRVDAAAPDGAAVLGLEGDVGGGGRFRAGGQSMRTVILEREVRPTL